MTGLELMISCGVVSVLVTTLGTILNEALKWRRERKAKLEDKAEEKEDRNGVIDKRMQDFETSLADIKDSIAKIYECVDGVRFGNQVLLYDRIKFLSMKYIDDGIVSFEDRKMLHRMHTAYHDYCKGNGDLDLLMQQVDDLPVSTQCK